jgi:hypothetical protein
VALVVALCTGHVQRCASVMRSHLLLKILITEYLCVSLHSGATQRKSPKTDLKSAAAKAAWGFKSPLGHQRRGGFSGDLPFDTVRGKYRVAHVALWEVRLLHINDDKWVMKK